MLPLALLSLLLSVWVSAFNLDVTHTILKEGQKDSLFGFSVALHKQNSPQALSCVLVGAPLAKGLTHQLANRTGGLFNCPIITEDDKCDQVDIDNEVDLTKESKENQWLGVTVKSQGVGGKVVTCAHRYESRQRVHQQAETRDMIGRCYVLSQDLTIKEELDGGDWKFCEGRTQGHERFGYCQQGISAGFTSDNHYILFGAPGTYNWKGVMFLTTTNSSDPDQLVYKTPDPIDKPLRSPFDVAQHSYLGFSVDSGDRLTHQGLSVVAGAPRANHTGAVVLLRKEGVNRLAPEHILWGEELGSSFGYSVATADLNSDGWTDLIVGAPYFFDRKEEIGGAVYVYINRGGRWDRVKRLRLNGTKDSLFGLAVASVGDVNQDGFGDIAVGAPYDGHGKVYIYHGNNFGLNVTPAQVLEGEAVGVTRFGYSVAGGLDMDDNFYPDVVVGSLSDSVVLYRARPVINVTKSAIIRPQQIDLEQENCKGRSGICIIIQACFAYSSKPENYNARIVLGYTVEADGLRRRQGAVPRIHFLQKKPNDLDNQYSGEIDLRSQHTQSCVSVKMKLQENIRDKLRPIPVTLTYTIKQVKRKKKKHAARQLTSLMPVLNAQESNVLLNEVNFLRQGCGEDKICQSNLQLSYSYGTRIEDQGFQPLPLDEHREDWQLFTLSDQKDIAMQITVTNLPSDPRDPSSDGDDAHEAMLIASFPDSLSFSAFRAPQEQQVVCVANQNGSEATCELGNPMKRGARVTFYLILSTSGITIETTSLPVILQLTTISEQSGLDPITAVAHVVIELPLSLSGSVTPHQVFFGGHVVGESAMKREEDVGSSVDYELTVLNTGNALKTLSSTFLNINWPHEISNGKWLLYPLKVELEGDIGTKCKQTEDINPLGLTLSQNSRVKREVESEEEGEATETRPSLAHQTDSRKRITLDCELGNANCVVYQCPLQMLNISTRVKIRARLWNSTFLEEYANVRGIELIIRAVISVQSSIKNLKVKESRAQVALTIYPEKTIGEYGGLSWLIILIAVLAGILVLALLVFLLWKCGFFKRSRYNDTVPQYHAVRIGKEDRQLHLDEKQTRYQKDWVTHWNDSEAYSRA
ncbi:integrin alpha-7 isoform X2 [Callorhinchus milii]|uniref:integrin alpha-7 isoform X2 n=1 Tax=Callorhinchus milii TaxID=7868 RepID=UPI001C3FD955|nr:integrin alpha-7 isoform X2 [Callorhinchus milii]